MLAATNMLGHADRPTVEDAKAAMDFFQRLGTTAVRFIGSTHSSNHQSGCHALFVAAISGIVC